jgi:hypothetical protein
MKENVADIYDQIKGESRGLGRLLEKIPGIGGYMEKGRRREADQILRDTISARLEASRLRLSSTHQELGRDIIKAMDHAEPLGRADNLLMGLIGKIKDAPQGYAGFFDAIKVREDDLARIYAFDESMLNHIDEVDAAIAALEKAVREDGDIGSTIRRLTSVLQLANQDFANRNDVILGIN